MSAADWVAQFHRALGESMGSGRVGDSARRRKLHDGEHRELLEALDAGDLAGVARELADVVYVAYGTAYSLGFDLDVVLAEVHRANMGKAGPDGRIAVDADGKAVKPPGWSPPDVGAALDATMQGWRSGHHPRVCPLPCPDYLAGRSCMFCDGGLSACTICGAFEGAWPDDCPGEPMSADRSDLVYRGQLNFRGGAWRDGECCEVMRPTHDRTAFMAEHGYAPDGAGGWVRTAGGT